MPKTKRYLIVVLTVVLLPACSISFGGGLDMEELEENIDTEFESQTGVALTSIDCPEEMDQEEGLNFTCDVTTEDGDELVIDVTQTDDEGNVEWELRQQ
jgi:hypothetical protein